MTQSPRPLSPTVLAAALGAGLVLLVLLLNMLATPEALIDGDRLAALVAQGEVVRIELGDAGIAAHLRRPAVLDEGGQRLRSAHVLVPGAEADGEQRDRWQSAGIEVAESLGGGGGRRVRELVWTVAVAALLLFGLRHLIDQARRHRREGSPRQRLEALHAAFQEGRVSREEYERQVDDISVEL